MAQARALAAVGAGTRLRWRPHLRARLGVEEAAPGEATGDRLVVRTPEVTTRLPLAARAAVERLLAGEVVTAAQIGEVGLDPVGAGDDGAMDASGLTDAERVDVARTLLRDALAVPE
jgi:hypothetical protein